MCFISLHNSSYNTVHSKTNFTILIMKANEMHYFSNLFDKVLYMFRAGPLSIIRRISTLYTHNRYLSCQSCWRLLAWSGSILPTLANFPNTKSHKNPSINSRIATCGQTDNGNLISTLLKISLKVFKHTTNDKMANLSNSIQRSSDTTQLQPFYVF